MTQYLVAICRPREVQTRVVSEDEAMRGANQTRSTARCRRLVSGFLPAACNRKAARGRCDCNPQARCSSATGRVPGTKEHIGGFWVLEATDLDEALAVGAQGRRRLSASVEVRPFH